MDKTREMRPFKETEHLSSGAVEALADWLRDSVDQKIKLTEEYNVGDLVNDLDAMANGIWNDGIDAMGEDA